MNAFFRFIANTAGRIVRIVAGLILVALGLWATSGAASWVLVIVGLVPLLAGLLDRCVFAPLFGLPFGGEALRQKMRDE